MAHANYTKYYEGLGSTIAGPREMILIDLKEDSTNALSAPAVEIVFMTLREGRDIKVLEQQMEVLGKHLDAENPAYAPVRWGFTVEKPHVLVGFFGWETVEAHWQTVATEKFKSLINSLRETVDIQLKHTKLVKIEA